MRKVLLDTDIGTDIDDAYALPLLLKNEDIDLLGVTTVSDDTMIRKMLADTISHCLGKEVPVVAGARCSLTGEETANRATTHLSILAGQEKKEPSPYAAMEAIRFLHEQILENPNEITLICIGPLTNVALLFSVYPDSIGLLKDMVIMAGSYFDNPRCDWDIDVEWNCKCDPLATKVVLEAPVKSMLVAGVDLTWNFQLPREEASALVSDIPGMEPIAELSGKYWTADKIWFHDPLACMLMMNPGLGNFEPGYITVDIQDEDHMGKTIFLADPQGHCWVCKRFAGPETLFYQNYVSVLKTGKLPGKH